MMHVLRLFAACLLPLLLLQHDVHLQHTVAMAQPQQQQQPQPQPQPPPPVQLQLLMPTEGEVQYDLATCVAVALVPTHPDSEQNTTLQWQQWVNSEAAQGRSAPYFPVRLLEPHRGNAQQLVNITAASRLPPALRTCVQVANDQGCVPDTSIWVKHLAPASQHTASTVLQWLPPAHSQPGLEQEAPAPVTIATAGPVHFHVRSPHEVVCTTPRQPTPRVRFKPQPLSYTTSWY